MGRRATTPLKIKLTQLTQAEHAELARLFRRIQKDLKSSRRVADRAQFSDQVLRVQKRIQETLIDQLREAWQETHKTPEDSSGPWGQEGLSVEYGERT